MLNSLLPHNLFSFFKGVCLSKGISFHGVYNRTVFVDLSFFFNVFLYSSFDTNQFFV